MQKQHKNGVGNLPFSSMSGEVVAVMVTTSPAPSALLAQILNSYVVFGIR